MPITHPTDTLLRGHCSETTNCLLEQRCRTRQFNHETHRLLFLEHNAVNRFNNRTDPTVGVGRLYLIVVHCEHDRIAALVVLYSLYVGLPL